MNNVRTTVRVGRVVEQLMINCIQLQHKCHTFELLPLTFKQAHLFVCCHNRSFLNMQQYLVVEMLPGSYRYANRKVQKLLHPESVQLIMEQQFSTVLSMHKEQTARVLILQHDLTTKSRHQSRVHYPMCTHSRQHFCVCRTNLLVKTSF